MHLREHEIVDHNNCILTLFICLSSITVITPVSLTSRWIRLLFSREFLLPNVLELWDALFVDGNSLSLLDYFFVVLLQQFRDKSKSTLPPNAPTPYPSSTFFLPPPFSKCMCNCLCMVVSTLCMFVCVHLYMCGGQYTVCVCVSIRLYVSGGQYTVCVCVCPSVCVWWSVHCVSVCVSVRVSICMCVVVSKLHACACGQDSMYTGPCCIHNTYFP